jgi:peptidoglycan lytic transglycosylase A
MRLNLSSSVLALLMLSAAGCATQGDAPPASPAASPAPTSTAGTPKQTGAQTASASNPQPNAAPVAGKISTPPTANKTTPDRSTAGDESRGFETRYARFEPADFKEVPDWQKDQMRDAWLAFLRGCKTLTAKQLWASTCTQATQVPHDENAIRRFIEQQFSLYQVLDPRGEEGGIITGYYEPLLRGNRLPDDKFRYPVYSVPGDLLYLDSYRVPKSYPKQKVYARVEGRTVVPIPSVTAPAPGVYPIEAGTIGSDMRDRRMRVRLDHNRIVRYYSRSEIETTRLPAARVLVWVDDPIMLYTMQVQGAGKVQLPDGKLMRLGFADQNGYPFRSKIKRASYQNKPAPGKLRGGANAAAPAQDEDDDAADADEDSVDAEFEFSNTVGLTRSLKVKRDEPPATREQLAARQAHDPSYVFFREIPDTPDGPIGALGVPLTAGRSVAVDPRITPLGAPLFLSTTDPKTAGSLNRLMVAQDTGGAIRGAVRADYFFGFGPGAGELANRMKSEGRLWLLLPKSFRPSAMMLAGRTRGSAPVDCVVADPEYCADAAGREESKSTAQQ